jgi:hypothetical protein
MTVGCCFSASTKVHSTSASSRVVVVPQDVFLSSERDPNGIAWRSLLLVAIGVTIAITGLWFAFRSVHRQNVRRMHDLSSDQRAHTRTQRASTTLPIESYSSSAAHQQHTELGALHTQEAESLGMVTGVSVGVNPAPPTNAGVQNADAQQMCSNPIAMDASPVQWCTADVSSQRCEGRCPDLSRVALLLVSSKEFGGEVPHAQVLSCHMLAVLYGMHFMMVTQVVIISRHCLL